MQQKLFDRSSLNITEKILEHRNVSSLMKGLVYYLSAIFSVRRDNLTSKVI